jgi:quinol monooxygenase YgiN
MLVDETNRDRFYFIKIFRNEKANEAHWETDVFKTWWNAVEELFDDGTERICTMRTIFPSVSCLE